ncbi:hypothetical protein SAMN05421821_103245 [Mucilaginibacter lappiensis]|uniref:Antitoxin VbhA domain-containing protein n=1 Tax=Mucilaginibacter lappiensis TaxID=354630 RepID=A0ABR6PGX5_9SPHI|nr:hypothetical protein [Mucilaginibacter lappiensis]MBB6109008.1 hypothetical protein [Mucilaginibacter lappiensis]SIQ71708.1 hypothetical protein SAMN05421821_103245 [Mucilaginibacter lappiensis]
MRISFPKKMFQQFYACPLDQLEEELSRSSIRMKLQDGPKTDEDRAHYQNELDRLSVLKYINQFRKGKLSREDFSLKVELADTQA